jgi:hypothetical protein
MSLCNCLHGIKVLTGYSDNVSGMVNMKALKVRFKKSHDCPILVGQFLPIAIRAILLVKVRDTIMKLFIFQRNFTKDCGSNEANKTSR